MLPVDMTRFYFGVVAKFYALPVLWMTPRLHVMARRRRREKMRIKVTHKIGRRRSLMSAVAFFALAGMISVPQYSSAAGKTSIGENTASFSIGSDTPRGCNDFLKDHGLHENRILPSSQSCS